MFITLLVLSVGLAMDAFAVSICDGMCMKLNGAKKLCIALLFGIFQGAMTAIGYLLGNYLMSLISPFIHWVAFALLLFLGGKMIVEGIRSRNTQDSAVQFSVKVILIQAVATSIDALAVGLTLHAVTTQIALSCLMIGGITFLLCLVGVLLGRVVVSLFSGKTHLATIFGGVALAGIGVKILLEALLG